jgi:hypothetical protein
VRVRFVIAGIAAAALIALPASASAKPGHGHGHGGGSTTGLAAQQCAQEKGDIGKKAFLKKYGARNGMRNCIRRTATQIASVLPQANQDCADELAEFGTADFILIYGDDASTPLDQATAECVNEAVDEILNGDDSEDDGSDG